MIDVVIPVHNALEHTERCMDTLYATTKRFRLIVVDDFSDTKTKDYLYTKLAEGKINTLLTTNRQRWWTRASNIGLRQVRTDRAVLLNSDCEMQDGWLREMEEVWTEVETSTGLPVGLVGSLHSPPESRRYNVVTNPNYVTGHCWLMGMEAFAAIAEDRGTPGWYLNEKVMSNIHINSDKTACYDLQRLGYLTVISYKSPVPHAGGKSWDHDVRKVFNLTLKEVDAI